MLGLRQHRAHPSFGLAVQCTVGAVPQQSWLCLLLLLIPHSLRELLESCRSCTHEKESLCVCLCVS